MTPIEDEASQNRLAVLCDFAQVLIRFWQGTNKIAANGIEFKGRCATFMRHERCNVSLG